MITNEKKPVIVFGYDNWVVGGVEKVLGRIGTTGKIQCCVGCTRTKGKKVFFSVRRN